MHHEAYAYVAAAVAPLALADQRILEIGSAYVNGSIRPLFADADTYVGIDARPGPGVDIAVDAAAYTPETLFDIVVSCETLEHADPPASVIACAARALRPGGLLILTAAGPEREPHGCDGGPVRDEPYTPITSKLLKGLLTGWEDVTVVYGASHGREKGDIYATARWPGEV